ncbi:MAG: penicillin-binding protein 2, partial [Deltaproteobacteria bacterium]|nr:penicillin-binding protein 2 [Deltaproteobacteria bacterium]
MSEYFSDKEPGELKFRAQMATVAVSVIFFVLSARLWQLQVFSGDYYRGLAENNRIRTVKSPAPRGMIYDRLGVKLAENRPGFDLYLVPEDVQDWDKTKAALKNLADITAETVDEKLDRAEGRPQFQAVKLKEDLTWEDTVKIESSKFELPGVILEVSPKRNYVYGEAVAHLIGYLGEISEKELKETRAGAYGPGDLTGKYGLEKAFEKDLRGVDGGKELEVDALGRKIKVVKWSPPYPGNDMKLTIDIRTQMAAWAALRGHAGAAVAMEPSTGKVIAMVSTPSFDPNSLSTGLKAADWQELLDNPQNILMNRAL